MQHYSLKIWIEIYPNRNIFLSSQLSFNLPLPLFIPYFSTFQFEAIKINIWIFSLRDLFFFCTGIFDSRITRISNIEIQSLFPYLRSCNASSIFKNRYRSCTWYIFANFSRNSASSLSLSLLSPCLSRWGVAYENRDYGREEIQRNRSKLTGTDDDIEDVALCR